MDSVVKVRRSFLNELRGFCNYFASMCDGCFRTPCSCALADAIHRAKHLIVMIDNVRDAEEERYFISSPSEEFLKRVEKAIMQGNGRPVKSSEIHFNDASRQRKARALKALLKRRVIRKITTDGEPLYVPADGNTNKKQNNKGERNGV